MLVWDTAGQERFNSIGLSFYRGTDVAILVYDITNPASFSHLEKWLADFRANAHVKRPAILLVGNKVDKQAYRAVSTRQAHEFASTHWGEQSDNAAAVVTAGSSATTAVEENCFEVSAKENTDVNKLFKRVADIVIEQQAKDSREMLDFEMDNNGGRIDVENPAVPTTSFFARCC